MAYSDDELLALVQSERRNSIGFDEDAELVAQREQALNYYKGDMPDVPAMKNRSKAQSSDIADAIETALPDLIEIFTGGDDVIAFTPKGPGDEKAAEQETDFVKHVFFQENEGFLTLYQGIKDALLNKVGVFTWWWDDYKGEYREDFTGKTAEEVVAAKDGGAEIQNLVMDPPDDGDGQDDAPPEPTFSFTAYREGGALCIEAVPPEDFTVARDTTQDLDRATYCALRSRPRAQDLIAQGLDEDTIARLPEYGSRSNEAEAQARDTVNEQTQAHRDGIGLLRQVEVITHYLRVVEDKKPVLYRIMTGADETILIDKRKVNDLKVSVITPYIQPHRLYGFSVADKLIEVQRIKTALMRMLLDSGFFALNQRMTVDVNKTTEFTLSDLMRNEPMVPIRVKGDGAVVPVGTSGLNFDVTGALEFFSVVGEQRTGIVRNAQGLNPDTLHDTASGALALMAAAQKRLRLIARVFAETGLKRLFLGIHSTLRENPSKSQTVRLRGQWVPVDPTKWGERADMTVEVGLGAAGREHDIAALKEAIPLIEQVVTQQGGMNGPIVTAQNVYALLMRALEKLGFKGAEQYISDPSQAAPQQPQPNPEALKAQGQMQLEQQKAEHDAQLQQAKAASDVQNARIKAQLDAETAQMVAQNDLTIARERMAMEFQLKREQAQAEIELKRQELATEAELKRQEIAMRMTTSPELPSEVEVGGEPG